MVRQEFPRHGDFIHLLYGKPAVNRPAEIVQIVDIIDGYDENNLSLLTRYLTTGSPEARQHIREYIIEITTHFQNAFDADEHSMGGDYDNYEEQMLGAEVLWEIAVERYEHPIIPDMAHCLWNTANVLADTHSSFTVSEVMGNNILVRNTITNACTSLDGVVPEVQQWRGIAALTISRMNAAEPVFLDAEHLPGFIQWAGAHEDIGKVIDVASERRTFHHETLQGILLEQKGKPALGSGVL